MQPLLRDVFGIERLRPGQEAVIERVMASRHTLAVMPTGAGKSLCYQLPALLRPGRTLVVSPLIALMKDQCDKLREADVAAVQFNSAIDADESSQAQEALRSGQARIVFATPERLADPQFVESVGDVELFVIDEVHCISHWGHDFRPAFLEIEHALPRLGRPTVLALTATASSAVIDDVIAQLALKGIGVVNTGVYRSNLHYAVEHVTRDDEKLARVLERVAATQGPGIVYAATVKAVETVFEALQGAGEAVVRYHGRLGASERHASQEAFMSGAARVMVATNAFGLGIDKADTRFVLHYQMPSGLDAYYQESGRAGRDGAAADCTLLYLHSDKAVQQFFLVGRYPDVEDLRALSHALQKPAPEGGPAWTLDALVGATGRPRTKLKVALRLLRRQRIVAQDGDGCLLLNTGDIDDEALHELLASYRDKREHDRAMLERMVFYGQTGGCRWKVLLDHFGEGEGFERCGTCDNCQRIERAQEEADAKSAAQPVAKPEDAVAALGPNAASPKAAFHAGDRVRIRRYGIGTVAKTDPGSVTVRFENGEERCFLAEYVKKA